MNNEFVKFQKDGLWGVNNKQGEEIIPPKYKEMFQFSCGLALVRNSLYQYAYINVHDKPVIPFGLYSWCDPLFVCGFARVVQNNKWGIIDTLGNIIVPIEYDQICSINENYIFSIKAFINNEEKYLNLSHFINNIILDGLKFIRSFTIDEFKAFFGVEKLFIKKNIENEQLYFTYGSNLGEIGGVIYHLSESLLISIVSNSSGKIFPLLHEAKDLGKSTLLKSTYHPQKKKQEKKITSKTSFWDYEREKMSDVDNWSDPYGDDRAYYNGWSREDIESGLADAYE